jgi:C4-dicarboxylate-binding protein DctP
VTNLDSLKGLKIRVPEIKIWVDFWRRLGANPTPLPYAEQYTALSTGVIDAVEADFFSIKGFKWFEQAKHLTLSYHWFLPKAVRVNTRWLDSLPADLQALVRKENRAKTDEALADLVKAGVTVHKLSADESSKWFSTARPLFDEFGNKSAETKAMVGRILAAR